MAKLKNVTQDEFARCGALALDAGQIAADIHRRADQGYMDEIPSPIQQAVAFLSASASLADVARLLILKASIQEQKREIEAQLRER